MKEKLPRYMKTSRFCSWCGQPIAENGKGVYCSDPCEHEHKIRHSHSYIRSFIAERDGGVCALCHEDTSVITQQLMECLNTQGEEAYWEMRHRYDVPDHRTTLWDVDHIVPVKKGGGSCGAENLRTLCLWCHQDRS